MEKMKLIQRIIEREWTLFDEVHNIGGRASCQDDRETFLLCGEVSSFPGTYPFLKVMKTI